MGFVFRLVAQAVIDDVVCIDLFYGFGCVVGVVRIYRTV